MLQQANPAFSSDPEISTMRRIAILACSLAGLALSPLPAKAERVVALPVSTGAALANNAATEPAAHAPFPDAMRAEPAPPLRLSATEKKPWCATEIMVGGFCMMN